MTTETASETASDWLFPLLGDRERMFLAGVLFARCKVYVGRGSGKRWLPQMWVEVPAETDTLQAVFGEPGVRSYYGATELFRYGLFDRAKLHDLCRWGRHAVPASPLADRMELMEKFCAPDTPTAVRDSLAEQLRGRIA